MPPAAPDPDAAPPPLAPRRDDAPALALAGLRLPSPISPQGATRLARLNAVMVFEPRKGWRIGLHDAPDEAERARFTARAARIRLSLVPAGEGVAAQAIVKLATMLRPRVIDGPEALAEAVAAETVRIYAELSVGPLLDAVDRFCDGREGRRGFAPEAAEVAAVARAVAERWTREADVMERAAGASVTRRVARPEPEPEAGPMDRAALAAQARAAFAPPATAPAQDGPPGPDDPPEAHLAHLERLARAPLPPASPRVRATLARRD